MTKNLQEVGIKSLIQKNPIASLAIILILFSFAILLSVKPYAAMINFLEIYWNVNPVGAALAIAPGSLGVLIGLIAIIDNVLKNRAIHVKKTFSASNPIFAIANDVSQTGSGRLVEELASKHKKFLAKQKDEKEKLGKELEELR